MLKLQRAICGLLAPLLVTFAGAAHAGFETGNKLYGSCTTPSKQPGY
jgi:hypothetical protein